MKGFIVSMICMAFPAFMLVKSVTGLIKMKAQPEVTLLDAIIQTVLIAFYTTSVAVIGNVAVKYIELLLFFR